MFINVRFAKGFIDMEAKCIESEKDLIRMKFGDTGYLKTTGCFVTRVLNGWLYDNRRALVFVPDKT